MTSIEELVPEPCRFECFYGDQLNKGTTGLHAGVRKDAFVIEKTYTVEQMEQYQSDLEWVKTQTPDHSEFQEPYFQENGMLDPSQKEQFDEAVAAIQKKLDDAHEAFERFMEESGFSVRLDRYQELPFSYRSLIAPHLERSVSYVELEADLRALEQFAIAKPTDGHIKLYFKQDHPRITGA